MLTILPISNNNYGLKSQFKKAENIRMATTNNNESLQKAPISAILSNNNINFKARITKDIEWEEYVEMSEEERETYRQKYDDYYKLININELYRSLPKGVNQIGDLINNIASNLKFNINDADVKLKINEFITNIIVPFSSTAVNFISEFISVIVSYTVNICLGIVISVYLLLLIFTGLSS